MGEEAEAFPSPPPAPETECRRRRETLLPTGPSSYDDDDLAVFHPSRHEGLHLLQTAPPPTLPPPSRHHDLVTAVVPGELHRWRQRLLVSAKCLIGSGMEFINSKIQSCGRGGGGGGCYVTRGAVWSFAALVGLVGALLYLRRRRLREKALLLLLQEKDQKISLLLRRIAQMNEIIAARNKVSVPRT